MVCTRDRIAFLLSVLLVLFSFFAIASSASFTIRMDLAGSEPVASNASVHLILTINNTDVKNITSFRVNQTYDSAKIALTGSSPLYNSQNGGNIIWDRSDVLAQNQSYTIDVYFNAVSQGIVSSNVSVNATFNDSSQDVKNNSTRFALGDQYENDNAYQNASLIPSNGTEQFHTFINLSTGAQDIDWVKFSADAGYYYAIQTENYSNINLTDTILYLYSTDGATELQENDDEESGVLRTSRIVWYFANSGTYYIKTESWDRSAVGGNYSISVEKQGKLSLFIDNLPNNTNVTRYSGFNVQGRLQCSGGECRNAVLTLDPQKEKSSSSKLFNSDLINDELDKNGKVDVIVKLKEKTGKSFGIASARGEDGKQSIENRKKEIKSSQDKFISSSKRFNLKRAYSTVMNGVSGSVDAAGLEELLSNENVEAVYYDRIVYASLSASVPFINARPDVWNLKVNGTNMTGIGQAVCIIDTGINYNHSDFGGANGFPSAKVTGGYDFVNNDNDPWDDHTGGHGSHVAGIVASENATYTGVAPGARIVAVKSLDSGGSGSDSNIISGIDWCVSNSAAYNISVISMSLGAPTGNTLPCDDDPLAPSINSAVAAGIIVFIASGNEHYGETLLPGIDSPGCISAAVSVGAVARNSDVIAGYSNRDWFLDMLAPGSDIISTKMSGGYWAKSGTSMATPHAAGVAALIQQESMLRYGRLTTPQDIKNRLKLGGVDVTDTGYTEFVFPRIDAYNSVAMKGVIPTTAGATPFYTNGSNPLSCGNLADGESCNVTWWVNATGTGAGWQFFTIGESDVEINKSADVYINIKEAPSCNITITPSSSIEYGSAINASCICTNPETSPVLYRNGTNVSSENSQLVVIAAGEWNYTCASAETQNYTSAYANASYAVAKNQNASCSISFNSTMLTYGDEVEAYCSCTSPETGINLYRNSILIANATPEMLSAGNHIYNCSANETQNYTSASANSSLHVEKDASVVNLLLNGTDAEISIRQGDTVNITAQIIAGQGSIQILENGSAVDSGAANRTLLRQYDNHGSYNLTANYTETQNYTSGFESHILTVNDTTPPAINISSPANSSTSTASYNILINATTDETASCSYKIDSGNYTSISTGTSFASYFSIYSNGAHNLTVNCTDSSSNSRAVSHGITINDTTDPVIGSTSPSGSTTDTTPDLTVNTDEPAVCYYTTDANETNTSNMTVFTTTNSTSSVETLSLAVGSYTYYVMCEDRLGNMNANTTAVAFTISSSGGGGGGGGGGSCSDECDSGEKGCSGSSIRATCVYNVAGGCWQWDTISCAKGEECVAGSCIEVICPEEWICSEWTECVGGAQERVCEDWNSCETTTGKPQTLKDCNETIQTPAEQPPAETIGEQAKSLSDLAMDFINPNGSRNLVETGVEESNTNIEISDADIASLIEETSIDSLKQRLSSIQTKVKSGELLLKKVNAKVTLYTYMDQDTNEEVYVSMITLKVTSEKDGEFIEVIHFIPKEIAESSDLVKFKQQPEILLKDPVVRWTDTAETKGETKEYIYFVSQKGDIEQLKTVAVAPSGIKAKHPLFKWAALAIIVMAVVMISYAGLHMSKKKKEADHRSPNHKGIFRRVFHRKKSIEEIHKDLDEMAKDIKKL